MVSVPKKYSAIQLTKIDGIVANMYRINLTETCVLNFTGMIFVWKNLSPSLVKLEAEKETAMDKNIIKTKMLIPGKRPDPSCSIPMLPQMAFEK